MSALAAQLVAIMVAATPASRATHETIDAARVRYEAIAAAIAAVTDDVAEEATLLAIAHHESGFRRDVDLGETRGTAGECGVWQIMPTRKGSCAEVVGDRVAQAKKAIVRASLKKCGHGDAGLAAYASGSCSKGLSESKAMVQLAARWTARLVKEGAQ